MARVRCKELQREYAKRHYAKNMAAMKARAVSQKRANKPVIHAAILAYLVAHPCLDCGEADPVVLQFDHRGEKCFEIGGVIRRNIGIARLMDEIAKCDVRCANCHQRKTYKERGYSHRG